MSDCKYVIRRFQVSRLWNFVWRGFNKK